MSRDILTSITITEDNNYKTNKMTERQIIRTGNISAVMVEALIEAIKTNERMRLSLKAIIRDEDDLSSVFNALGNSFPIVVHGALTGSMIDPLTFNHEMNSLCFKFMSNVETKEQVKEIEKHHRTDDIMKPLNQHLDSLAKELFKSFAGLCEETQKDTSCKN